MKYTKENIVEGIYAKLDEMQGDPVLVELFKTEYKNILVNYPKELEQNVLEWINDLPITEIKYHDCSIKKVLDGMELSVDFFPMVLRNFIAYEKDNCNNVLLCYSGFIV